MLLSGFVHLVLSQVCTRLITFALNLLNARLLTPEAYGVSPGAVQMLQQMLQHAASPASVCSVCALQLLAVQFHLINTTILFLSREGFRRGCLRIKQVRLCRRSCLQR